MQNDPGYRYMLFAIGLIFAFFLFYDSWKAKTPKGESYKLMQETTDAMSVEALKALYVDQASRRKVILEVYLEKQDYGNLYNVLVPEVFCAGLARVGNEADGGKWVCNPLTVLTPPCSIYSLGVSNDVSFDVQIQTLTNQACKLYAFDKGEQNAGVLNALAKVNGKFRKATIGGTTNATAGIFSLPDLMKENNDKSIEMLKMDIEGAEFAVIPQLINSTSICQIFVEVHSSAFQMVKLLKKMSQAGFYLFSYEINGFYHQLCEFSLIHESCLSRYGVDVIFARYLS